jgi:DNA-binding LacI/PurR family transcriptional regulator/DNA-binding transcriptional regulator YhcF (GntR family)
MSNALCHQPKAKMAFDELVAIIAAAEPNSKLPSTGELKRKFGVSTETLNLAIRELEREHRIYSVRGIGIFVAPSRHTILLCDTAFFQTENISPFWQILLDTAQAYADEKNENFKLHFLRPPGYKGDPLPVDVRNLLQTGKINGVLGINLSHEVVKMITALNAPVVNYAGPGLYTVNFEDDDTIDMGVPELARRGCRKIALWQPWGYTDEGPVDFEDIHFGEDNLRMALENIGLSTHPEMVRMRDYLRGLSSGSKPLSHQEQGFWLATEMFSMPANKRPDGIVIDDDMMARGVLEAFEVQNINVGRDILIATMSNKNSPVLQPYEEKLIRVEYDPAKLVKEMFHFLHKEAHMPLTSPRSVSVRGHLVVGAKVGANIGAFITRKDK